MLPARLRAALQRIDIYLVLLLTMMAAGLLLPPKAAWADALDGLVWWAVWALFFLYGARLSLAAVWEGLLHWRLQGLILASTYGLMPLLGLGVAWLARGHLHPDLVMGIVFLTLLPSTVQSSIALTAAARGNIAAALCAASISNLLGVIVTPLLASLVLGGAYGFSAGGLQAIALQLLLPFALGQLAKPLIGAFLARHRSKVSALDRGSILLIVYSAFSEGTQAGVWKLVSLADLALVLLACLAVLALTLALTAWASRRARFATEDEIAVVFCGSKKSMATGLPLARILFAQQAGLGMIVLPLMIYHQAQLFVCASLARHYAKR
jgi:sodium/bile acid cotransporter 7